MSESFPYTLPVRATIDCEILDAKNLVVCPTMFYRGDVAHIEKQKKTAQAIADAINLLYGENPLEKAVAETPRRGRPPKIKSEV